MVESHVCVSIPRVARRALALLVRFQCAAVGVGSLVKFSNSPEVHVITDNTISYLMAFDMLQPLLCIPLVPFGPQNVSNAFTSYQLPTRSANTIS